MGISSSTSEAEGYFGFRRKISTTKPKLKLQHETATPPPKHKLYGHAVNTILMVISVPGMAYLMYIERNLENSVAITMIAATALTAIFGLLSWKYESLAFSRLSFVGNCFSGAYMELKEWPIKGACTVTQRFQLGVLVLCLANISLSVQEQVVRLTTIFLVGSYVSLNSPFSVYTEDALPHLGGAILVAFIYLYVSNNSTSIGKTFGGKQFRNGPTGILSIQIQKDEFLVRSARVMIAAIYAHQVFKIIRTTIFNQEANADLIFEAAFELTKTTIMTTIGSIAAGVFKTNIDQKEQLELMVRKRTKEIRSKNIELRRIHIAFEACETAIAITDASRTVIWANQAFEALAKRTRELHAYEEKHNDDYDESSSRSFDSSVECPLTDAIVLDGHTNQTKLRGAFDFLAPRQDEIEIRGNDDGNRAAKSQYRLEVTPFTDNDEYEENSLDDKVDCIEKAALAFGANGDDRSRRASTGRRGSFQSNRHKLFLVAFHDITANRAREQAEQNAREEALLSKAMKESMVTLTHELRTPLQGIMGITSLMLEQQDPKQLTDASFVKDSTDSLGLIMASSSLLLNLINNLLDVKKATANMMEEFQLTPLLASDPIRDAIDFCNPLASISNVNISMDCCNGVNEAFVNANTLRLQQVLINMISNAIKYTDQGSNITVRTRPSTVGETIVALRKAIAACSEWEDPTSYLPPEHSPVLIFSVSDCGPGIAMYQAKRLFQRFARLSQQPTRTLGNNTVGQPSGTGLGLHLCQMFVMRMRGWIWAENNPGKGSTFSFCLPLVRSPEAEPGLSFVSESLLQAPLTSAKKRDSNRDSLFLPSTDYRKLRVLVVDDTLINRKVLDRMLKKIGIAKVTTAESGKDALEELFSSGNKYDLVITDLQMPGMSGMELTKEINRKQEESDDEDWDLPDDFLLQPTARPLVIVGLTADTSPGVTEKCARSGMSDLLYKPITLVEIKDYFQTKVPRLHPGRWRHHERRLSAQ